MQKAKQLLLFPFVFLCTLSFAQNVGIGTVFPQYKLDVRGDGSFFTNNKINFEEVISGTYKFTNGAVRLSSSNLLNFPLGIENNVMAFDGSKIQSFVQRLDDPYVSDYPTSLSLNAFGGNLGIGTATPIANSKVTLQTDDNYATALTIQNPSGSVKFQTFVGGPVNGNTISLGTPGFMPIAFYTNSANRMFITGGGNVGIGTDNPTYKLSVNGNIRSKEVVVETANWPDYVFNKKYELQPLYNLEKYIQLNNHLPNIPAAADVEKNGVQLGDMQKKMLEKIEELTLYVIALKKEIDQINQKK